MTQFDQYDNLEKGLQERLERTRGIERKVQVFGWLKDLHKINQDKKNFARKLYERFTNN